MTGTEIALIITNSFMLIGSWAALFCAIHYRNEYMKRIKAFNWQEKEHEKLKYYNGLFIKLNNNLLDQMDEILDKRKFNGTKHKQR